MRNSFGSGIADYVVRPSDGLWGIAPNTTVSLWDSADGGTRHTDLLDASGMPVMEIVTNEYGAIPPYQGPDGVTGMWADAGGTTRAWVGARITSGGGSGGGGGYSSLTRVVASATAPADVRAAATYVCDGVADQAQIQQAINDARDHGGGVVQLTVGDYNLTAPLSIEGTDDVDVEIGIALLGQGARATMLVAGAGLTSAIHLTKVVRVRLCDFGITVDGATHGITSATTNGASSGHRSFWNSAFANLQINGPWNGTHTGWAMNLGSPFRSTFTNLEVGGVGNGIRLYSEHADFNPGDSVFERIFVDSVGNNMTAYKVESTTAAGVMNQIQFEMCEAIASGTGCTGIQFAGVGGWGTAHIHWRGGNFEDFDKILDVAYGSSNTFRFNHIGLRPGVSGLTAFNFGANSFNNTVLSTGLLYVTDNCKLYSDANTVEPGSPNRIMDTRVYRDSATLSVGGQLNPALTTVRKGIIGNSPLSSPKPQPPGVYIPEGWGKYWLAARNRAAAGTGLARIVTVGGSATLGYFASDPRTKSWPGLVGAALQSSYGDGGSGFHGVSLSQPLTDAPAYAAWLTAGAAVAQTGTWTQGGSTYGPGATYLYSDTTGATLTFRARGTTVRIFTVTGSGTRPAMLYSIDGGADVSVPQPSGTAAIQTTTITGLSNTTHTVVVKVGTATSGQYVSVCGVSGENTSGVILHNVALAGATSSRYANNTPSALNAVWNGGVSFPADLAVYSAAPNDAAASSGGVTADVWLANVLSWFQAVRSAGIASTGTDVLIALPHIGTHEGTNAKYIEYSKVIRPLADIYGFALVNWWVEGQQSWDWWNSLGYWGSASSPGAVGADGVHLSDQGFQHMADTVLASLAS
ncbi:SGNH/GDSL hydrolase family protein [Streptomyces sp. NPDC059568]|uniref:SGNH/GDSL hydrolase family protein n=1 Tax=Streptomyces sp. NPDC059568 TaxID=3346868 RepID=UPI00367EA119